MSAEDLSLVAMPAANLALVCVLGLVCWGAIYGAAQLVLWFFGAVA